MSTDNAEKQNKPFEVKLRYTAQMLVSEVQKGYEETCTSLFRVKSGGKVSGELRRGATNFALYYVDKEDHLAHIVEAHGLQAEILLSAAFDGVSLFDDRKKAESDANTLIYEASITPPKVFIDNFEACVEGAAVDLEFGGIMVGNKIMGKAFAYRQSNGSWSVEGVGVDRRAFIPADVEIDEIVRVLAQDVALQSIGHDGFCQLIREHTLSPEEIDSIAMPGVGTIYERPGFESIDYQKPEGFEDKVQRSAFVHLWPSDLSADEPGLD